MEEVEQFYKNKAEAKNKNLKQPTNPNSSIDPKKPVKRGRPQGSKNKKKMKSQDKENENKGAKTNEKQEMKTRAKEKNTRTEEHQMSQKRRTLD